MNINLIFIFDDQLVKQLPTLCRHTGAVLGWHPANWTAQGAGYGAYLTARAAENCGVEIELMKEINAARHTSLAPGKKKDIRIALPDARQLGSWNVEQWISYFSCSRNSAMRCCSISIICVSSTLPNVQASSESSDNSSSVIPGASMFKIIIYNDTGNFSAVQVKSTVRAGALFCIIYFIFISASFGGLSGHRTRKYMCHTKSLIKDECVSGNYDE
ncbi:hypothetical protein GSY71_11165 [Pusillimonas sp. TS35]|uniref:hypothetical protein n=1 Tax=Paracandidimonas lactea TaxID=2895524 RepID=UPI00136DA2CA|nr:hypothetical protein [Paracandidimonas lactea]MYN13694.1 hypothetical protein [Pusillimonas sp. TS35]